MASWSCSDDDGRHGVARPSQSGSLRIIGLFRNRDYDNVLAEILKRHEDAEHAGNP